MTSEQGFDKEDYSEHFDEPSLWAKLSHGALDAGRRVVELALTLFFCFRDPETPMRAKAVIASALGYFILPLDAIPDFTPVVGFADDLGALMMAAAVIAAHIKPKHRQQARQKLRESPIAALYCDCQQSCSREFVGAVCVEDQVVDQAEFEALEDDLGSDGSHG